MSEKKRYIPPSESLAHKSLLDAAEGDGLNRESIRQLFRLINAHPDLVAHARVFANLAECLKTRVFSDEFIASFGEWRAQLDDWRAFCSWASDNAKSLSKLAGLEDFDRQQKAEGDHPILGTGVGRHGVVAALWNRHESGQVFPLPIEKSLARNYFLLQAHLALSYIESRWRHCTLEFYESYTGSYERPIAPALSNAAARAVREFSLAKYNEYLNGLNAGQGYATFIRALQNYEGDLSFLGASDQATALRLLGDLKRYFRGFGRILSGLRPRRASRRGGSGSGGGSRRPGYVPFETPGVYFTKPEPRSDDEDLPWTSAIGAYIDSGQSQVDDPLYVESTGLSPDETLEEVFKLIDPLKYGGALQNLRFQRLAVEMSAQSFPWSWENLTRSELRLFWVKLTAVVDAYYNAPPNRSLARYHALVALALKVSLLFGLPIERVADLRLQFITDLSEANPWDPPQVDDPTLFVRCNGIAGIDRIQVIGFGLPAIAPLYKTELPEDAEELSRPLAEGLLLPDLLGIGASLLKFRAEETRQDRKFFHIELPKLKVELKALLDKIYPERLSPEKINRVTPEKIERVLAAEITRQTGDQSLAWIVTSNQAKQNEPRMHYTRHGVDRIRTAYINAATAVLKKCGVEPVVTPDVKPPDDEMPSIGCRFVLKFDELKNLIGDLQMQLPVARRVPKVRSGLLAYNNLYVFYTYLFQSLWTSIRAIVGPTELYWAWREAGTRHLPVHSSLSDKDSRYFDKSRLIEIPSTLATQYRNHQLHEQFLVKRLGLTRACAELDAFERPLLIVTDDRKLEALRPAWVEKMFAEHLGPVPANFHRAFLRTELLLRNVPVESIDAFLGHANAGEAPFGLFSTFDYHTHLTRMSIEIGKISDALGLVPIESRLVPYPTRLVDA